PPLPPCRPGYVRHMQDVAFDGNCKTIPPHSSPPRSISFGCRGRCMGRQNTGKSVSRRKLIGFAAAAIVMPSRLALARAKTLRGSVSYVERIALPPDAIMEVRLIDVSLAD